VRGSRTANDCAAFLTGSRAEYRLSVGQPVACCEWTNLLGHGNPTQLRGEIDAGNGASTSPRTTGAVHDAQLDALIETFRSMTSRLMSLGASADGLTWLTVDEAVSHLHRAIITLEQLRVGSDADTDCGR
jgi:hypothetical protein